MKKSILTFLIVIFALFLLLGACNTGLDSKKEEELTKKEEELKKREELLTQKEKEEEAKILAEKEAKRVAEEEKKRAADEEAARFAALVTEEERTADVIAVKKLTPEAIVRVKIPKTDVIVKINQIENKDYPMVKLFVSVTDTEGHPLELDNPNLFVVEENGVELLKSEIKSIIQQKSAKDMDLIPLSAVLAIDKSGSMALTPDEKIKLPEEEQPMFFAKNAAIEFLNKIQSFDNVEFITFDHNISYLGTNFAALEKISALSASGHTALYGALFSSVKSLENKEGIKAVILLTDGKNDVAKVPEDNKISHMPLESGLELATKLSIPVFTIGLGKGVDHSVLERISKETHATYFATGNKEDISMLYDKIRSIINNQYIISYNTKFLTEETEVKVDLYGPHDIRNYQNVEELVEKEKEYQNKLTNLDDQIKEYDTKFKQVEEKEKTLIKKEDELNKREEQLDKKEVVLEQTRKELEVKKEELAKKDEELKRLEQELASLDTQLNDKDKKLASLQSQLAGRENNLNKQKEELETKQLALNKLQTELDALKKTLDTKEVQLDTLNTNLNKKQTELNTLNDTLNKKQTDLNKLSSDLNKKSTELNTLNESLNKKQAELNTFNDTLNKKQTDLNKLSSDLNKKSTELNTFRETLNKKQTDLDKLSSDLNKKSTELNTLKDTLDKKQTGLNKLSTDLSKKQKELDDLEKQLLAKSNELNKKEGELKVFSEQLNALEKTLEEERKRLQKIKEELLALLSSMGEEVGGVNP